MKLEEGMYVRTEYGIAKIEEIKPDDKHKTIWYTVDKAQYHCFLVKAQDIIKSSPNIIDLIEVGDYVNGDLVLFAGATTWDNDGNVLDKQVHINHNGYDLWLREEYIKSIVTKEQFESMSYKVGVK